MADIWDNLNTTKIGDEPGTVIDTQTRNIHLEKRNKELLSDVNLINQATFRDGRPMPGTGQIFQHTQDATTRAVWFTPQKGEVWKLIVAGSTASSAPSGAVNYYLYISCKDQNGDDQIIYSGYEQSGSTEVQLVDFLDSKSDWYIDENMSVQVSLGSMQGVTSFNLKMLAIRVR